jgi:hypothetical protein
MRCPRFDSPATVRDKIKARFIISHSFIHPSGLLVHVRVLRPKQLTTQYCSLSYGLISEIAMTTTPHSRMD